MGAKKRLLFVIDSLNIGGAEKSLVTLLNLLDYSRYEVDLQLFGYGGRLERFLPSEVNVLPPLDITGYLSKPLWRQLCCPAKFLARIGYSLKIRNSRLLHPDKACIYWKTIGRHIDESAGTYDTAIAYAQGIPTFYVIDKIRAAKKLAWVNAEYRLTGTTLDFQRRFYNACDAIVPVSELAKSVFAEVYPEFESKMQVVRDIIDPRIIESMSRLDSDKKIDRSSPVIMTVGRLNKASKGSDLALAAAKILNERGAEFRWYAVGNGPYRNEMEQYIADNGLQERFILLGATSNPYSYMRQCDIYVQTSRHEGFGLTIAEARILNRPVVCTNFDGCTMQIIDGRNGLITSFEPADIADAVERLLTDKALRDSIEEYLKGEKKGNTEELGKFYKLVES